MNIIAELEDNQFSIDNISSSSKKPLYKEEEAFWIWGLGDDGQLYCKGRCAWSDFKDWQSFQYSNYACFTLSVMKKLVKFVEQHEHLLTLVLF